MRVKAIINGKMVTPYNVVNDAAVVIQEERIRECGTRREVKIPEYAEIIDAGGNYIGPGFIDIHCHGGGGYWVYENPDEVAVMHLKHGVTSILTSLAYNLSSEEIFNGINKILLASKKRLGSFFIGIHMEGPYINPKYGAYSNTARHPDPDEYNCILNLAGDMIKVWTFAPELEGIDEFIEAVSKKEIILAVGHSETVAERIYSLIPRGLKLATHCFNATGVTPCPTRFQGTREVGVDEAVMVCDDIYTEVMADSAGVHVKPIMLKLLYKVKGADKIILISDAINYAGTTKFEYVEKGDSEVVENNGDLQFSPDGGLAGARMTLDYAARNMMNHTGASIVEAFKMVSLNPATMLGMQNEIGSMQKGKIANIVIVNGKIEIKKVIFKGELV